MNESVSTCAKTVAAFRQGLDGLRPLAFSLLLAPVLYGAGLTISGVPSALACSPIGGEQPPPTGVNGFYVRRDNASQPLAIANDGFFIIEVGGTFATPEDILASIAVEVTDAAGQPIAGSLHAFSSTSWLYWLAAAPLADGAYTATVSAPSKPELAQTVKLDAQGAPTKLALPSVEPRRWLEYHHLTGGKQLTCDIPGMCGPTQFGELEESSPGVDLRVFPSAPINGQIYWEAYVRSADDPTGAYSSPGGALLREGNETGGELRFAKTSAEYCVLVTVRDLRDDQQLTSSPVCFKPGTPQVVDETNIIAGCQAPPSPALLAAWCKHHQDSSQCRGVSSDVIPPATMGTAGTAGTAGITGNPAPSHAGASVSPAVEGDPARDDDTSNACHIGHSRGASPLGSAGLLGLAVLGLRRWRRTRAQLRVLRS